jgi:hypothetical protein
MAIRDGTPFSGTKPRAGGPQLLPWPESFPDSTDGAVSLTISTRVGANPAPGAFTLGGVPCATG